MLNRPNIGQFVNDCGGIDIALAHLANTKIWPQIDSHFGPRHPRAKYSFADTFQTLFAGILCGSKRLEHIHDHQEKLIRHPKFGKGLSPDTYSRITKLLAVKNVKYAYTGHKHSKIDDARMMKHETNLNMPMNILLLDTAIYFGLLKPGQECELDIDATTINTKILDARRSYTGDKCYSPMVIMLNKIPIFIEMRNGNTSASFRIRQLLKIAIDLFESRGLIIKIVRSDAAACNNQTIEFLEKSKLRFYIRASKANFRQKDYDSALVAWDDLMEKRRHLKTSEAFIPSKEKTRKVAHDKLRVVQYRHKDDRRTWAIITNDLGSDREQIINHYNQRGDSERSFTALKELGWKFPPHRKMKHNSVYFSIIAEIHIIYLYLKKKFSGICKFVNEKMKIETFRKRFIKVITSWENGVLRFWSRKQEFQVFDGVP